MKLKTYVGRDLQEALALVKKELGPEAVILSTHSTRSGQKGGSWERRGGVEVTAAVDTAAVLSTQAAFQAWTHPRAGEEWGVGHLREEMAEMKALFRQWLHQNGPPSWLSPYPGLAALYQLVLRAGVHEQIIRLWLEGLRDLLQSGGEPQGHLKERALRRLMERLAVVDLWKTRREGSRCWAFLGPTGVGKTTTIAKLAVRAAFMKKMRVALVSLDHVRLGGHDQLKAYARIAGLDLVSVQNRRELERELQRLADHDLVLIDTPGRNPRSPALPFELNQALGNLPQVENHLVLPATAGEESLADALQGFGFLPLGSAVITKVDESRNIAGIFNQLALRGLPVSFVSTGQRVPEDLELANRRRLTGLLLKPQMCPPPAS
jgi:flagellar biosynthesis protein FlhF